MSAPKRTRAPSAMARAVSSLTAPYWASSPAGTDNRSILAVFAYATTPPSRTEEAPGTSVTAAQTIPPVQDSAVAMVSPASEAA